MSILRKNDISAGIDDPGAKNGSPGTAANDGGYNLPNSKKIYVAGEIHPDIGVPFREISLAPTKTMTREIEVNEPVRVYDTSGPWSDPEFTGNVEEGLPPLLPTGKMPMPQTIFATLTLATHSVPTSPMR